MYIFFEMSTLENCDILQKCHIPVSNPYMAGVVNKRLLRDLQCKQPAYPYCKLTGSILGLHSVTTEPG